MPGGERKKERCKNIKHQNNNKKNKQQYKSHQNKSLKTKWHHWAVTSFQVSLKKRFQTTSETEMSPDVSWSIIRGSRPKPDLVLEVFNNRFWDELPKFFEAAAGELGVKRERDDGLQRRTFNLSGVRWGAFMTNGLSECVQLMKSSHLNDVSKQGGSFNGSFCSQTEEPFRDEVSLWPLTEEHWHGVKRTELHEVQLPDVYKPPPVQQHHRLSLWRELRLQETTKLWFSWR